MHTFFHNRIRRACPLARWPKRAGTPHWETPSRCLAILGGLIHALKFEYDLHMVLLNTLMRFFVLVPCPEGPAHALLTPFVFIACFIIPIFPKVVGIASRVGASDSEACPDVVPARADELENNSQLNQFP